MLPKIRGQPSEWRHQQDGESGKRLKAAPLLRYTPYGLAVRRRGLPLLSWMAVPEELNPSQNRGGTVISTKYPNPSGARRHRRWRTRFKSSEALGQARSEELTLVASYPDGAEGVIDLGTQGAVGSEHGRGLLARQVARQVVDEPAVAVAENHQVVGLGARRDADAVVVRLPIHHRSVGQPDIEALATGSQPSV